jgi:hypothetical protein
MSFARVCAHCRLPRDSWLMDKLDQWVDPLDVVNNGCQHQHTVGQAGVKHASGVSILFHDAGVVSPVTAANPPSIFQLPLTPLTGPVTGFSAVLMQNAFSTNTPQFQWDLNFRWRFAVTMA